ncbi:polysaccharide pyruvyl transferase family protein [Aromatoleum anaerobium]|uniref:Polysaccharide pyruvyl transferase family protein n=1 Tax=Aromatoleum anaerobium TaxID=182180 RepID=A0ABX1PIX3_9RHOO|nr:polysaccharide pyruvyl transferase family protein [Aromatoleum anaerobium]MCK0506169.1 polysaccharide pyruvyl transferase family protein [Aromatoleum anaerobium]
MIRSPAGAPKPPANIPTILFGAFDRHNFGDLLFPHVVAAMLDDENPVFAGLVDADLRRFGGHAVSAIAPLAAAWGERPVNIIHVGGEILTCGAWHAAVMLLPPQQAHEAITRLDARPREALEWAQRRLGTRALAPYCLPKGLFSGAAHVIFNAVGGTELGQCDAALRAEVLANLHAAEEVGVRDRETLAQLAAAGVPARLVPDPAVMVAALFGERIARHARAGEIAQIRAAFPQGYLAVQFSADFGDDATLDAIAAGLERSARSSGHGVALFRAGAAPWHDDRACYARLVARLPATPVRILESLDIWDICALIAASQGYCGSSLHGRIVAMAFALPRLNLLHPAAPGRPGKQTAFAATWEPPEVRATVAVDELAGGIANALNANPERLRHTARELVEQYRSEFDAIRQRLE